MDETILNRELDCLRPGLRISDCAEVLGLPDAPLPRLPEHEGRHSGTIRWRGRDVSLWLVIAFRSPGGYWLSVELDDNELDPLAEGVPFDPTDPGAYPGIARAIVESLSRLGRFRRLLRREEAAEAEAIARRRAALPVYRPG